jgi:hypothetical protein
MSFDPNSIPLPDIPAAIIALSARLLAEPAPAAASAPQADESDTLLTTAEAAVMLRRSAKWLYRHAKTLPFARQLPGGGLLFSKQGIAKWLARQRA